MSRWQITIFFKGRSYTRYIHADAVYLYRCLEEDCSSAIFVCGEYEPVLVQHGYEVALRCPCCGYRHRIVIPMENVIKVYEIEKKTLLRYLKENLKDYICREPR